MSQDLDVARVDELDRDTRLAVIALCEAAYDEDFGRLFELLPASVHVLKRDEAGVLISHAAWVPRWLQAGDGPLLRAAYVEAVATAPDRQHQGHASQVLELIAATVSTEGDWDLAALSPSEPGFYARLGWELWSGPLAIRRDGHIEPTLSDEQVMILRLPTTPTLDASSLLTAEWREGDLW